MTVRAVVLVRRDGRFCGSGHESGRHGEHGRGRRHRRVAVVLVVVLELWWAD